MSELRIECRFIAHSYTGVRQGGDGRDQLDWPPAPARLHQAFIATTLANLPASKRAEFSEKTLEALRWLESLPPPDIIASTLADDTGHRRALNVAMPHNSPAKGDFTRYHPDLAPVFHATPEHDGPLLAAYRWADESPEFADKATLHVFALRDASAKLRYIGRAEDRVECEVLWPTGEGRQPLNELSEVWRPVTRGGDTRLLTVRSNSTRELMEEFRESARRIARGAKRPPRTFLREQSYARDAAEGLLPVHTSVFRILRDTGNPDQLPEVCDSINAHRWRSPLRALACKIADDPAPWNNQDAANELISGHITGGGHTQQPHLAFVPLPSLSLSGKADGRVRRFALLGYAQSARVAEAESIYRTLAAILDGAEIEPGYRLQLISDTARNDKVWPLYTRASRTWISVTPVVIDRGYKVPTQAPNGTPLSRNERHLRRHAEWTQLLRASLRHIRLPEDLIESCDFHLTLSPILAATERAERYRPKAERTPFMHVKIEFARPVRGPLLLGDRRYIGLGLFVPAKEG